MLKLNYNKIKLINFAFDQHNFSWRVIILETVACS
jgi:hypothetical protein